MRRLVLLVALSLCRCAFGQLNPVQREAFTGSVPVSAPPGPTYLVTEDFEGTWAPTGWTTGGGTPAPYQQDTNVLAGTKSLWVTNGVRAVSPTYSGQSSNAIAFAVRFGVVPNANLTLVSLFDGSVQVCQINGRSNGAIRIQLGTPTTADVFTVADTSTIYYMWLEYEKGTGANAVVRFYYSTTTTKPGAASATLTNGTSTTDATNVRLMSPTATYMIYDTLRVVGGGEVVGNL